MLKRPYYIIFGPKPIPGEKTSHYALRFAAYSGYLAFSFLVVAVLLPIIWHAVIGDPSNNAIATFLFFLARLSTIVLILVFLICLIVNRVFARSGR